MISHALFLKIKIGLKSELGVGLIRNIKYVITQRVVLGNDKIHEWLKPRK